MPASRRRSLQTNPAWPGPNRPWHFRSAMPPSTAGGIAVTQRATTGKSPRIARIAAMILPMCRLATPVIYIAVDLLAECGHVFVQDGTSTTPCFGCAFPNSLVSRKAPCFVPAAKDILKVTAGIGLYAVDSLLMDRKRNWNYRRIHLAGYAPDVLINIEQNPECPLCSKIQQGSPAVGAATSRASTGSDSL